MRTLTINVQTENTGSGDIEYYIAKDVDVERASIVLLLKKLRDDQYTDFRKSLAKEVDEMIGRLEIRSTER